MRFWMEHYGCTLNQGETLMLKELALQAGHVEAEGEEEADLVIFGSCVVIDQTERKMWKRLKELSSSGKKLIVGGCLPQVAEDRLRELAPDALVVEPGKMEEAAEYFGNGGVGNELSLRPSVRRGIAVLPIATGCEGECTYCITHLARGKLCSRPVDEIVSWADEAIKDGAKELRLSSQDNGVYGWDIGKTLPELMWALLDLEGDFMLRVGMMNPHALMDMVDEMVEAYHEDRVYKFLHMPVQSGSDAVLRAMKRNYTVKEAEDLAREMRERIPGLTLSTDIIVGFPGETEKDFEASLDLIKAFEPDIVNVTRFSPRPGTSAENMKEQVHGNISKERSRQLTELRFQLALKRKEAMVGQEVPVHVLGGDQARTQSYVPVVLEEVSGLRGEEGWVKVRITGATPIHVTGVLVNDD